MIIYRVVNRIKRLKRGILPPGAYIADVSRPSVDKDGNIHLTIRIVTENPLKEWLGAKENPLDKKD